MYIYIPICILYLHVCIYTLVYAYNRHTFVQTNMNTRILTYMHACMQTYSCMHFHVYTYKHTKTHAYMHACIHTYIHTWIQNVYKHTCTCQCIDVIHSHQQYIYIYIYMYINIYIFTYIINRGSVEKDGRIFHNTRGSKDGMYRQMYVCVAHILATLCVH